MEWAEKAVREGANLAASDALEQKVIDLIATDEADLLAKLHGRKLTVGTAEVTLATHGLPIETVKPPHLLSITSHSPVWIPARTSMPSPRTSEVISCAHRIARAGPSNVA